MLTGDMVRVRCTQGQVHLVELKGKTRKRAVELAQHYIEAARAGVGQTRAEFDEAAGAIKLSAREHKLALGLRKMVADRCTFEMGAGVEPPALREAVFLLAAERRKAMADDDHNFDREAILAEIAERFELPDAEAVDRNLYADLKQAHQLISFDEIGAEGLVRDYQLAQAQAVLYKAVKVTARVRCADAGAYRALFNRLKFLRLMHTIRPDDAPWPGEPERPRRGRRPQGYCVEITGPFNLFSASTKYGLQLALALPALRACTQWRLVADLRWGKLKKPMIFELEGGAGEVDAPPPMPDEVQQLIKRFKALESEWRVTASAALLNLPGAGLCVPDLVFSHRRYKKLKVYLEVMGYWSRDAVWRRVELVERGLPYPVIFAVSSRLRVSEKVLDEDLPGSLYVYKGAMMPKAILKRLESHVEEGQALI